MSAQSQLPLLQPRGGVSHQETAPVTSPPTRRDSTPTSTSTSTRTYTTPAIPRQNTAKTYSHEQVIVSLSNLQAGLAHVQSGLNELLRAYLEHTNSVIAGEDGVLDKLSLGKEIAATANTAIEAASSTANGIAQALTAGDKTDAADAGKPVKGTKRKREKKEKERRERERGKDKPDKKRVKAASKAPETATAPVPSTSGAVSTPTVAATKSASVAPPRPAASSFWQARPQIVIPNVQRSASFSPPPILLSPDGWPWEWERRA